MSESLVIGLGNPYRRDDAAGLAAARRLAQEPIADVRVVEAAGEGTELMALWAGAERVFLIDAARGSAGPGRVRRLDAAQESVPSDYFHYSTHAFSLAEAVELARALGELPPHLVIYAIEGADFGSGEGLTPAVAAGAIAAAARIRQELTGGGHA